MSIIEVSTNVSYVVRPSREGSANPFVVYWRLTLCNKTLTAEIETGIHGELHPDETGKFDPDDVADLKARVAPWVTETHWEATEKRVCRYTRAFAEDSGVREPHARWRDALRRAEAARTERTRVAHTRSAANARRRCFQAIEPHLYV